MANTFQLSKREKEVVKLLLEGKSNKQIASVLGISLGTVEFHLTNIYAKLGVRSRSEAIVLLDHLRETLDPVRDRKPGEKSRFAKRFLGKSQVVKNGSSADNGSEPTLSIQEVADIATLTRSLVGKYKMLIAAIITLLILATIVAIYLYLTAPKPWQSYTRECEYPDEVTVGQTIGRSNASGSNTHGQFGASNNDPWPAMPGSVTYKNINTPFVEQLYMRLRYSKYSPSSVPILVFMNDEANPRAAFYPADQGDWNRFAWTEPIFLGTIENGVHTIRFTTEGQQYGVADLDKFVLTAGSP